MKKINTLINSIAGAALGIFIGHIISCVWTLSVHPETYMVQSAPWYTSSLIYGAITVAVLITCFSAKEVIKRKLLKTTIKIYWLFSQLYFFNFNYTYK